MRTLLLSLVLLQAFLLSAQNQNCGNNRFFGNVFSQTTSTLDIKYGENTTVGGTTLDLLADVYEPSNDPATQRPLIILMHGGSFIGGDKADMGPICEYYAKKGFVVASISYRLFDGAFFPLPDSNDIAEVVVQSTSDLKAAIRWFKNDAINGNQFNIDTNYVFSGGVSAGAISALHAEYMDASDNVAPFLLQHVNAQGGWEGNSNAITGVSSAVQGVFNFSGALYRANYIQTDNVPVFSVHDELDDVVPYGNDFVSLSGIPLLYVEGSETVQAQAQSVGVESELNTIWGSAIHVSYFSGTPEEGEAMIDQSTAFMVNRVVCPGAVNVNKVVAENTMNVFPNPAQHQVNIAVPQMVNKLVITNVLGQKVFAVKPSADEVQIDASNWTRGMYVISSFDNNGELVDIQKLLVK